MPLSAPQALPTPSPTGTGRTRRPPSVIVRLVRRTAAGDHRACDELVDEFAGLVWAITRAHQLAPADAADVVQVTWLRLVERIGTLRDPAKVGSWLAAIARHECLSVLRRQTRLVPHAELPERIDDASDHDVTLIAEDAEERDALLWAAFERLGARDRALLRLLTADPRPSYEEISAALQMPIGSIGPTRARALRRLRRHAEGLGLTDDVLDD